MVSKVAVAAFEHVTLGAMNAPMPWVPAPSFLRDARVAPPLACAGLVLLVVLGAGLFTWQQTSNNALVRQMTAEREIAEAVEYAFHGYELGAYVARGLFDASQYVDREEWQAFVATRKIREFFPGALGFAYLERVSEDDVDDYVTAMRNSGDSDFHVFDRADGLSAHYDDLWVIKYNEPEDLNGGAIGFNAASHPASLPTIMRAIDGNVVAMTEPLRLVQTGTPQWGTVMFLPVFTPGAPVDTPAERRAAARGCIGIPIAINTFLDHSRRMDSGFPIAVFAERQGAAPRLVYTSHGQPAEFSASRVRTTIAFGGTRWVLCVDPTTAPGGSFNITAGVMGGIGAFGILITLVIWSLARTRQRALEIAREITDQLAQSQERFALAVEGSQDGLWDWDLGTNTVYYAPRWCDLLGLDRDEIDDSPDTWLGLIATSDVLTFQSKLNQHIAGDTEHFDIELKMFHADGEPRWMLCRGVALRDETGKANRVAGSLADITALKHAQEELRTLALHDGLTGLPNRDLFTDRLRRALARSRRNPSHRFAVLFFDFDRFKVVNDSLGHDVGDALLMNIAERFRSHLRETDTASRFGGDEFVVLLDGIEDAQHAEQIADRFLDIFSMSHQLADHDVVSSASIGVVTSDHGYTSAEDMLRDADVAMYQAKASGKARYCVFDQVMHEYAVDQLVLEQDMRRSMFDEEFVLHYQPIVSLRTGDITGFEALVRWHHPTRGVIRPDLFISIAEETGQIVRLGEWILRQACLELARWKALAPDRPLYVNVNLSRRQLVHPQLLDTVSCALSETGITPSDLRLEITETTVMDDRYDVVPVMEQIRELGVAMAMDDFGTGHSSLSCLHRFPIDVLKIDRSFIANIDDHHDFIAVLHAIVTLAQHLDLEVVAEGIETPEQLVCLQAMDCGYAQGYLFAAPLPADQIPGVLANGVRVAAA